MITCLVSGKRIERVVNMRGLFKDESDNTLCAIELSSVSVYTGDSEVALCCFPSGREWDTVFIPMSEVEANSFVTEAFKSNVIDLSAHTVTLEALCALDQEEMD